MNLLERKLKVFCLSFNRKIKHSLSGVVLLKTLLFSVLYNKEEVFDYIYIQNTTSKPSSLKYRFLNLYIDISGLSYTCQKSVFYFETYTKLVALVVVWNTGGDDRNAVCGSTWFPKSLPD